jgi:hypothetical protein
LSNSHSTFHVATISFSGSGSAAAGSVNKQPRRRAMQADVRAMENHPVPVRRAKQLDHPRL